VSNDDNVDPFIGGIGKLDSFCAVEVSVVSDCDFFTIKATAKQINPQQTAPPTHAIAMINVEFEFVSFELFKFD